MNREKEPEQLASIALSREEIASRQRTTGKLKAPVSADGSSNSKVLWALTVFALIFCVGLLVELNRVKAQSELQLKALTVLQEKLTSTDEQANLSVDAMRILLKEQDHEIRKLWDLANKRNKVDIAKNTRSLASYNKKITQLTKQNAAFKKQLASLTSSTDAKIVKSLNPINSELKQTQKDLTALNKKVDGRLTALPDDLAKTLDTHDKGIKAMDATRLQLMRRIQALDKRIDGLSGAPSAPVQAAP